MVTLEGPPVAPQALPTNPPLAPARRAPHSPGDCLFLSGLSPVPSALTSLLGDPSHQLRHLSPAGSPKLHLHPNFLHGIRFPQHRSRWLFLPGPILV